MYNKDLILSHFLLGKQILHHLPQIQLHQPQVQLHQPPSPPPSEAQSASSSSQDPGEPRQKRPASLKNSVIYITSNEKRALQEQWARAFYKNFIPFAVAEDPEFKNAMEMTRPGVGEKLLSERRLAGSSLEKEHATIDEQMRARLQVGVILNKKLFC